MAKPRVTIVGLGLIGNSIGLALSQEKREFEIVGHDKESKAAALAKKMRAVDKTDWNLLGACEGADLVILALPLQAIRSTLEALANELKAGCVVIDTASVKAPILGWANELLPETVRYVGTNPIVSNPESGGEAARADLFLHATWAICPAPTSDPAAVQVASDLAERLGAQPLYLDPTEHDSMMAAVEHLPALLSTLLFSSITGRPGWREMRRLAGGQFESTTRLVSADPQIYRDVTLANQENLARWIETFIEDLKHWREVILAGDSEALDGLFAGVTEAREQWQRQRQAAHWQEGLVEMPERQSMLTSLLGFGGRRDRRN